MASERIISHMTASVIDRNITMKKRHLLRALSALTLSLTCWGQAQAQVQTYPTKPVRLIVPFPAGGATDLFARTLSQKISEKLGQTLVVENRPGAGGTLGADQAAKARNMD